ncbi:hypothetical protein EMGBS2_02540 [Actinomycetota bacterium]|nr:hypothetical protein EMGBS2_02540 [Actinomycetota bacterium]
MIDNISSDKKIEKLTASPNAKTGEVVCAVYETQVQEGQGIAEYFAKYWFDESREKLPPQDRSTFAVLVRSRSQIEIIQSALNEMNIPTDVVGIGGLIHTPEVADIIALLRTLTMPDAWHSFNETTYWTSLISWCQRFNGARCIYKSFCKIK